LVSQPEIKKIKEFPKNAFFTKKKFFSCVFVHAGYFPKNNFPHKNVWMTFTKICLENFVNKIVKLPTAFQRA
jgi:hypothetical protein